MFGWERGMHFLAWNIHKSDLPVHLTPPKKASSINIWLSRCKKFWLKKNCCRKIVLLRKMHFVSNLIAFVLSSSVSVIFWPVVSNIKYLGRKRFLSRWMSLENHKLWRVALSKLYDFRSRKCINGKCKSSSDLGLTYKLDALPGS